jgi:hypothetical protein
LNPLDAKRHPVFLSGSLCETFLMASPPDSEFRVQQPVRPTAQFAPAADDTTPQTLYLNPNGGRASRLDHWPLTTDR